MINVTSSPWTFKRLQMHDFVTFGLRHMVHLGKFRRCRMLPDKYNLKINPENFTSPQSRYSLVFYVTNGMPWLYGDLPSACLMSHWLVCSLLRECVSMLGMVWFLRNYLKLKGAVVGGDTRIPHNLRKCGSIPIGTGSSCKVTRNHDICSTGPSVRPQALVSASLDVCSLLLLCLQCGFLCFSLHREDGCPTASEFPHLPSASRTINQSSQSQRLSNQHILGQVSTSDQCETGE